MASDERIDGHRKEGSGLEMVDEDVGAARIDLDKLDGTMEATPLWSRRDAC